MSYESISQKAETCMPHLLFDDINHLYQVDGLVRDIQPCVIYVDWSTDL